MASAVTETAHSLADKFREAARFMNSPSYDGVEEKGLRMLVFGKPGSGKVSWTSTSSLFESLGILC